jgi:hypothetical protein
VPFRFFSESLGKCRVHGSGKYPVNIRRHSGARESANPESISTVCGYGFRACALRRIPE